MRYDHTPVLTSDATPTVIATLEIPEDFSGWVSIIVVAKEDTGTLGGLRAEQRIGFNKTSTLTLDTPVVVYPIVDDIGTGGFVAQVNGDENLEVVATGLVATDIQWVVRTDYLQINATNFP